METNHTKGIWNFTEHPKGSHFTGDIWVDLGHPNIRTVACITDNAGKEESIANAAYIVKCVNSHEELVKALEEFLKVINRSDAALYHYGDAIKMAESALEKAK